MFTDSEIAIAEEALSALSAAGSVQELDQRYGQFGRFAGALFGEPEGERYATSSLIRNVRGFIEAAESPAHALAPVSLAVCARDLFPTSTAVADFVFQLPSSDFAFGALPVGEFSKKLEESLAHIRSLSKRAQLLLSLVEDAEDLARANAEFNYRIQPFQAQVYPNIGASQSRRHDRQLALHGTLPGNIDRMLNSRYMRRLVAMNQKAADEAIIEAHRLGIRKSMAVALWSRHTPPQVVDQLITDPRLAVQAAVVEHPRVSTALLDKVVSGGVVPLLLPLSSMHTNSETEFLEQSGFKRRGFETEIQLRAARRLVERGVKAELQPAQVTASDLHVRVALCEIATAETRPQTLMRGGIVRVHDGVERGAVMPRDVHTWSGLSARIDATPFPIPATILRIEKVPFGWTQLRNLRAHVIRDAIELDINAAEMKNCSDGFWEDSRKGRVFILAINDEDGDPIYNLRVYTDTQNRRGFRFDEYVVGYNNDTVNPSWLMEELSRVASALDRGEIGLLELAAEIRKERRTLEPRSSTSPEIGLEKTLDLPDVRRSVLC